MLRLFRFMLMEQAGGDGGAGGGGLSELDKLKAEFDKTKKELEELKLKNNPNPKPKEDDEDDLFKKSQKEKEDKDKQKNDSNKLERALHFNMQVDSFYKDNESFLPSDVKGIIESAAKENYDSATSKANALKSGIIQAFFKIESNYEYLTPSQKISIEDYLKLTKNGKEEEAAKIYENIFEPIVGTIKKIKKAEELHKKNSGFGIATKAEDEYKKRLIEASKKKYLKEKGN